MPTASLPTSSTATASSASKRPTAMARAIRERLGADLGIGITGVAGPEELEGKPVGLGYVAIAGSDRLKEMELKLPSRRIVIKRRLSNQALIELRKLIASD